MAACHQSRGSIEVQVNPERALIRNGYDKKDAQFGKDNSLQSGLWRGRINLAQAKVGLQEFYQLLWNLLEVQEGHGSAGVGTKFMSCSAVHKAF
jgi:hypothetical protein